MPKEKREAPIPSKQEQLTMENGSEALEMDMVSRNGQMVLSMMDIGKTIEHMGKESLFTILVKFKKETGSGMCFKMKGKFEKINHN